jgi:hypothetical protein
MLRVIQRYFTCEGIFNMVYQYHIRLLMHFTGKQSLNLPFYLLRSLGKMSDKVQAKSKLVENNVFHSRLIKMLVLEELKNIDSDWDTFLTSSGFQPDIVNTPQTKRRTPTSVERVVHTESRKRRKIVKEEKPSEPTIQIDEGPTQPVAEEISPISEPSPVEPSSSKARKLKGNKLVFIPPVVEPAKPRRPFTRETTRQHAPVEEGASKAPVQQTTKSKSHKDPIEIIEIKSPSEESNPTFKRLRKQLKEARVENEKLKKENLQARIQLKENIGMCEESIAKEKHMVRRTLPLHRQVKNVYMKNRFFQDEIIRLKKELQQSKEHIAKRNLDLLAQKPLAKIMEHHLCNSISFFLWFLTYVGSQP